MENAFGFPDSHEFKVPPLAVRPDRIEYFREGLLLSQIKVRTHDVVVRLKR